MKIKRQSWKYLDCQNSHISVSGEFTNMAAFYSASWRLHEWLPDVLEASATALDALCQDGHVLGRTAEMLLPKNKHKRHFLDHTGQLSLLPLMRWEMSTGQNLVILCGWEVKAVTAHSTWGLNASVARKTVLSLINGCHNWAPNITYSYFLYYIHTKQTNKLPFRDILYKHFHFISWLYSLNNQQISSVSTLTAVDWDDLIRSKILESLVQGPLQSNKHWCRSHMKLAINSFSLTRFFHRLFPDSCQIPWHFQTSSYPCNSLAGSCYGNYEERTTSGQK